MYCGQCGKKVMDNMLFCPFCGSPIVIPEQDEPEEKPQVSAVQETVRPEKAVSEAVEESAAETVPVSLFDLPEEEEEAEKIASESEAEDWLDAEFADEKSEDDVPDADDGFVPLSFEDLEAEAEIIPLPEIENDPFFFNVDENAEIMDIEDAGIMDVEDAGMLPDPGPLEASEEPVREAVPPRRPARPPVPEFRRQSNTYIPVKEIDPEDMFMDSADEEDPYDEDDDDAYDVRPPRMARRRFREDDDDDFDYEEPEHGSFVQRHIRGIVGLVLLVILLLICLVWAVSPKGQISLAKMNLAWTAQPYADLGYEAYQQNSDLMAARYYEKAYSREPENYEYAHSAMVAYYEADRIESAAAMLKKCIEMQPDNPEPYQEMLILYPDAAKRPWEISELVRLGYQRTGDESLKAG